MNFSFIPVPVFAKKNAIFSIVSLLQFQFIYVKKQKISKFLKIWLEVENLGVEMKITKTVNQYSIENCLPIARNFWFFYASKFKKIEF